MEVVTKNQDSLMFSTGKMGIYSLRVVNVCLTCSWVMIRSRMVILHKSWSISIELNKNPLDCKTRGNFSSSSTNSSPKRVMKI